MTRVELRLYSQGTDMQALKQLIDKHGSVRAFAAAAGVSPQAVYFWLEGRRQMSAETAIRIERAVGVSRKKLLPEIFGK